MPDDQNIPDHMNDTPPPADEGDYGATPVDDEKKYQALAKTAEPGRVPPHNFEAEKALLGALMANNRVYERIPFLRAEHFADPTHSIVFDAIAKQIESGHKSDPITLSNFFKKNDALNDVGGNDYLVELAGSCVSVTASPEYARIIADLYVKRELIHLGTEIVNNAHSGEIDATAQQQREWAEARLFELGEENAAQKARSREDILASTIQELDTAYRKKGTIDGLKTGLTAVDNTIGGIPNTSLTILAGRPGMGKTAIAVAVAYKLSMDTEDQVPAALFSLEMGAEQVMKRLISDQSSVPHGTLRSGNYHDDVQYEKVISTAQRLNNAPLYIDDSAGLSVAEIKARLRRLIRTYGVKVCIIDYLTHIRPRDPKSPKVYQVEQITRDLKAMAKEFRVPIILLCQLSRAVEQREDKRPILSDLRDSGAIEQDADQVLFAYRKAYYLEREEPTQRDKETMEQFMDRQSKWARDLDACKRICEIIIAKNRHGSTGAVNIFFDPAYQRVRDIYEEQGGML